MADLVCVRISFRKPLVIEFVFPIIQSHCMTGISLQVFFFFRSKSVCRIFFSEITHTCPASFQEVKWSAPFNHPLNCHQFRFPDPHSFSFPCFAVLTDQNSEKLQFPSEWLEGIVI